MALYNKPKNPVQYPPAYVKHAELTLGRLEQYFSNIRVMSEALGSSYEYLSDCHSWRIPGPAVVAKLENLLDLCKELEQFGQPRTQIGWWLACVHFSLRSGNGGRICPGRLLAEDATRRGDILAAAEDDFLRGSPQHRLDLSRSGADPAAPPWAKDPRATARHVPWFILQPPLKPSLAESRGLKLPASSAESNDNSALASLLEQNLPSF